MNNTFRTNIYSLALGAKGVGKIEGKVCFVEGALPDEEVVFEVTKKTPSYLEGKVKEIIIPSPDRIEPECPYYGLCGGCQLGHISYQKELYYKKIQIDETIKRIGAQEEFESLDIVASESCYNYRSSLTLHRSKKGYGFFEKGSKKIIEIQNCRIANQNINAFLKTLSLEDAKENLTLKVDYQGKVWSSSRMGDRFFEDKFGEKFILMSPKAFSQTNRNISMRILKELDKLLSSFKEDSVFFDVYCGTGFFTFLINAKFKTRIGCDSNRVAIDCARSTMQKYGYEGMKFYKMDVDRSFVGIFDRAKGKHNVIFLDPPRVGVGKKLLKYIKDSEQIDRIYYLSCDPGTLARDIKILTSGKKWKLTKAIPFDMFPRTKHIEILAEFVKK